MRGLAIFALGMIATGSAATNTVMGISVQRCSSSPNAVIAVMKEDRGVRGAHLDIYREIEHGERPSWAGLTGKYGVAEPPLLRPGNYRIVAGFGKLDATMFLTVSTDGGNAAMCEIELTPADAPRDLDWLADSTAIVRVRAFRGVVQDEFGAVIPHAKIRVLRKSSDKSDKEDLATIQSDEKGQFSLDLDRGTYLAVFQFPGFKTQVVSLKVSKEGWDAVRLTMAITGTANSVPPQKFSSPN